MQKLLAPHEWMQIPPRRGLRDQKCPALVFGEDVVAPVNWLGSNHHSRKVVQRCCRLSYDDMRIGQLAGVEQVRRERRVGALMRVPIDVGVREEPPRGRCVGCPTEPEDYHVHMGHAARIRAPREGAVGEGDFQPVPPEQERPELAHLLTLGNGIGGHESEGADPCWT